MRHRPTIAVLALLPALGLLPACSTTWQDNYRGAPKGAYAPTQGVTVREVPWSRVDDTLRRMEAERAASDTHWDEWTSEQRLAEQGELLKGLQISEDPRDVIVLGRSVFRSTDDISPTDGSLDAFARSIGADYAVWSANYLGTKKVAEQEPVYEHGSSYRSYTDGSGNRKREYVPWDRTVYVPVVVDADEYVWVVYYLRKR